MRHSSSAAETSWPFSPAPSTPRPPPPLGPLVSRLSSTLLAPFLSSAKKRSRQRYSRIGCRMVLADARRLLTAAMIVHLLASPNASMGLRLASSALLHPNAAVHGTCALPRPAAPRSPVSCMYTRSHLASRTLNCRGGPCGWPPSPSKSGRQSSPQPWCHAAHGGWLASHCAARSLSS